MASWADALLFGLTLLAFVIGLSSVIMGILPAPAGGMKEKVEYGFFGVAALVISLVLYVALVWQ